MSCPHCEAPDYHEPWCHLYDPDEADKEFKEPDSGEVTVNNEPDCGKTKNME